MKIRWMILLTLMAVCLTLAAGAETMYIDGITVDRVHLRQGPAETTESLGLYFTGTPVERIVSSENGWSRVRIGSASGYVCTQYLSAAEVEPAFPLRIVDNPTSDWVNVRSGASFEAEVLTRLDNENGVELMGETASGWSYVMIGDHRGYIVTDFLSALETPEPRPATQIIGTTEAE